MGITSGTGSSPPLPSSSGAPPENTKLQGVRLPVVVPSNVMPRNDSPAVSSSDQAQWTQMAGAASAGSASADPAAPQHATPLDQGAAVRAALGIPFAVTSNKATNFVANLAANKFGNIALAAGVTPEQAANAPKQSHDGVVWTDDKGKIAFNQDKAVALFNQYTAAVGHSDEKSPGLVTRWLQDSLGYDSVSVDTAFSALKEGNGDIEKMLAGGSTDGEIAALMSSVYGSKEFSQALKDAHSETGGNKFLDAGAGVAAMLDGGKTDAWSLASGVSRAALMTANYQSPAQYTTPDDQKIDRENTVTADVGALAAGVLDETKKLGKLDASNLYRVNGDIANTLRVMAAAKAKAEKRADYSDADAASLGNALAEKARSLAAGTTTPDLSNLPSGSKA